MIHTFKLDDPLISTFESFRKEQEFRNDKLSHNYSALNFNFLEQEAFSIGYKNNIPFLFSTIFRRTSWPEGAYRILNRTWKADRQFHVSKSIDQIFLDMIDHQHNWLKENKTDFKIAFISREHNSRNTLTNLAESLNTHGNEFYLYENRVWMCNGPQENCFQDILYTGDVNILKQWKLKD
jgi:hypothetical protein